MGQVGEIVKFTVDQTVHLAPWFMLAVLLGVAANLFALDILARRSFRKHGVMAVLLTTAIGAFSPFCSFTVIPLIRRFLKVGVPLSAIMAFWVASPSMDPEIFALSAVYLGTPIAIARLVGALALSLAAGFIVLAFERRGHLLDPLRKVDSDTEAATPEPTCGQPAVEQPERVVAAAATAGSGSQSRPLEAAAPGAEGGPPATEEPSCAPAAAACGSTSAEVDDGAPWWPQVQRNFRNARPMGVLKDIIGDTIGLGKWFVLAMLVNAIIIFYVPEELIAGTVGAGAMSILVAALISVPLYVNGVAAIPVVDGLLVKGMEPAAAVTFLIGGAVTTIPAMAAVRLVVNSRVFLLYLGISFIGSVLIGLVSNVWL